MAAKRLAKLKLELGVDISNTQLTIIGAQANRIELENKSKTVYASVNTSTAPNTTITSPIALRDLLALDLPVLVRYNSKDEFWSASRPVQL